MIQVITEIRITEGKTVKWPNITKFQVNRTHDEDTLFDIDPIMPEMDLPPLTGSLSPDDKEEGKCQCNSTEQYTAEDTPSAVNNNDIRGATKNAK
ncbi:hypothetical protein AB6A40_008132 [Gnathostoma spinigerum]|uniref:Uncharacterized protein n=1 Tax=Gnathostoma spinigerum TaxID=75299 RepID=A0ABD6ENI0_9BILA